VLMRRSVFASVATSALTVAVSIGEGRGFQKSVSSDELSGAKPIMARGPLMGFAPLNPSYAGSPLLQGGCKPECLIRQHCRIFLEACRRFERNACLAGHDMDMQMEHDLPAGRL